LSFTWITTSFTMNNDLNSQRKNNNVYYKFHWVTWSAICWFMRDIDTSRYKTTYVTQWWSIYSLYKTTYVTRWGRYTTSKRCRHSAAFCVSSAFFSSINVNDVIVAMAAIATIYQPPIRCRRLFWNKSSILLCDTSPSCSMLVGRNPVTLPSSLVCCAAWRWDPFWDRCCSFWTHSTSYNWVKDMAWHQICMPITLKECRHRSLVVYRPHRVT